MTRELALDFRPDAECRRIGCQALRKFSLDLLELAKQPVVVGVRQRRAIENVVLVGRAVQDDAQLGGATKLGLLGFLPRTWLWGVSRGSWGERFPLGFLLL
jgi:hypothetical protein